MRVLITRPVAAAAPLIAELQARRHDVILAPMLNIEPQDFQDVDIEEVGAVALTSANAVPALETSFPAKDIPVFAVGGVSGAAARSAGFSDVQVADGDVESLARLIQGRRAPENGTILHMCGEHTAGELSVVLGAAGYRAETRIVYRAVAATALPGEAAMALAGGKVDAALFFSARSARIFLSLVKACKDRDRMTAALKEVRAIAISKAVADELQPGPQGGLWRAVDIALQKSSESMVAALDVLDDQEDI